MRNSPCPCGSGRKFKRCCYGKPAEFSGPCEADGCKDPGAGGVQCATCGHCFPHCKKHHGEVVLAVRGHILRAHPEKVPGMVKKLTRDETRLVALRTQHARNPEAWEGLVTTIWPKE